jgi:UDP-N-acetylglucosamine 4,6-dehydratase/5-epimerase
MLLEKFYNNKVIMITGGTGSIGIELALFILKKFKVKKLILYSRDEQKHFVAKQKLNDERVRYFIGDIRDLSRLNMALKDVDYVVHAAALKHVDQCEYNPQECIKTNIYGSENVIQACIGNNIKKCVLISTDKAVNPVNLYGASKLAAEKIFLNANYLSVKSKTIFSVVRYGNVIGSKGSIIPLFAQLIKQGKEITLTDINMTRFWISYDQAVKFVLNSLCSSKSFETYVPILKSTKILNLAKIMNSKTKIKIIGIKKGEKIHEELISSEEFNYLSKEKNSYVINVNRKPKKNKFFSDAYTSKNCLIERPLPEHLKIIKGFL